MTLLAPARHHLSRRAERRAGHRRAVAGGDPVTAVFNLPAVIITVAVTALLIVGVSESATVNAVIVVIKVAVVLIVIGAGAFFIVPANYHPVHSREHRALRRVRLERHHARRGA